MSTNILIIMMITECAYRYCVKYNLQKIQIVKFYIEFLTWPWWLVWYTAWVNIVKSISIQFGAFWGLGNWLDYFTDKGFKLYRSRPLSECFLSCQHTYRIKVINYCEQTSILKYNKIGMPLMMGKHCQVLVLSQWETNTAFTCDLTS